MVWVFFASILVFSGVSLLLLLFSCLEFCFGSGHVLFCFSGPFILPVSFFICSLALFTSGPVLLCVWSCSCFRSCIASALVFFCFRSCFLTCLVLFACCLFFFFLIIIIFLVFQNGLAFGLFRSWVLSQFWLVFLHILSHLHPVCSFLFQQNQNPAYWWQPFLQ